LNLFTEKNKNKKTLLKQGGCSKNEDTAQMSKTKGIFY